MTARPGHSNALLVGQAVLAAAVLAVLVGAPARGEAMLVLQLPGAGSEKSLPWLLAAGAAPLRPGPVAGSWIVAGPRDAIVAAAWTNHGLALSAGKTGCGDQAAGKGLNANG